MGAAFPWNRVFHLGDPAYVDGDPPRAVLTVGRVPISAPVSFCALYALDPAAADEVLPAAPPGEAFFFLSDRALLGPLNARAKSVEARPAWLYRLEREDFVDDERHETRPVGPEWAGLITKHWEPDAPMEPYVRSRIEAGPTFGIYDGDRLVAWYLTHLETDRVVITGFLNVLEEYRRRGYARSLTSAIAKEVFRRGKVPACHVYADNAPSLALKESMGYRRVRVQVFADAVIP